MYTRYIGATRSYWREVAFYRVSSLTYTFHLCLKYSGFFLDGSIDLYFSKQFEGSSHFFSGSIELYISLLFLTVAGISEVDL